MIYQKLMLMVLKSMSSEVPSFNLIFVGGVVFFLLDDVQSIGQEEVDRVDRGQTEAERHSNAGEYLGHTQNIGNCGLENTSDIEEVIGILRADLYNYYIFRTEFGGYMIPKSELGDKSDEFQRFIEKKTGKLFVSKRSRFVRLREWMHRRDNEPYHL